MGLAELAPQRWLADVPPCPYMFLGQTEICLDKHDETSRFGVELAAGVDWSGHRRVLGVQPTASAEAPAWDAILTAIDPACRARALLVVAPVKPASSTYDDRRAGPSYWQRTVSEFVGEITRHAPLGRRQEIRSLLDSIYQCRRVSAARRRAGAVARQMHAMHCTSAAEALEADVHDTLTFMQFPVEHRVYLRELSILKVVVRQIKRVTAPVQYFEHPSHAVELIHVRLAQLQRLQWDRRRYLDMTPLKQRVGGYRGEK